MSRALLRVVDSGVRPGRENIALDQALIEGHRAGSTPDTLRFLGFAPSALVGRHQDLSREIDVPWCRRNGIDVGRRITGGGAIYLDPGQLGWELICRRERVAEGALAAAAATLCGAAAAGLSRLGINARYRPRNDIEVAGQKIGGTGGFFDGSTLFYQGTVIIELDAQTMFSVLRVPHDKRARHAPASAAARVTSVSAVCAPTPSRAVIKTALTAALAEALGYEVEHGALSVTEEAAARALYDSEIGNAEFVAELDNIAHTPDWSTAFIRTAGGNLHAALRCRRGTPLRLEQVLFSGDFFITPPRVMLDLEAALRDVRVEQIEARVRQFFVQAAPELMSMTVDDVVAALDRALAAHVTQTARA